MRIFRTKGNKAIRNTFPTLEQYPNWEVFPDELIQEFVELEAEPFELIEDVVNSIEDIAWSKPDLYYDNEGDELMSQWTLFKNIVKHKSRFLFSPGDDNEYKNIYKILNEVGRLIVSLNLIHKVPKGSKIYRCRQHNSKNNY